MELLGDREPGIYKGTVMIPAQRPSLNYFIMRIFVADGFRSNSCDRIGALQFTITDIGSPGSQFGKDPRLSILQPMNDWQTIRNEK